MVTAEQSAKLREPFGADQVGKLPKGGTTLDYVGHGAVTDRLLSIDPEWNWEPLVYDSTGMPAFVYDADLHPIALWIKLTVCGVTRLGVGTCPPKQFDAEKVLIGDALRNAAMRFGVALDLWIRGQAEDDEAFAASDARQARGRRGAPDETRDKRRKVKKLRDELSAPALARLIKFAQDNGLPDPDRLTSAQADQVLAWLEEQNEAAKLPKSDSGGATDREAVDTETPDPSGAERADVDSPPGPSTEGTLV